MTDGNIIGIIVTDMNSKTAENLKLAGSTREEFVQDARFSVESRNE